MAQIALSAAGQAVGGPIGARSGAYIGSRIDNGIINALTPPRQVGPRLSGLQLASTAEGAPMPAVFGRARVAGQMLWAARFTERRIEQTTGGGKGGPRTVSYAYSLSFAVGLCEGPIDGVGRIWADGTVMDTTGVTVRSYLGGPDQTPDPLIEAVEGQGAAPAYRGLAYLVFENLPLDAWGSRPPSLQVEVFRRPRAGAPALEDRLRSVCLIPGAGEFDYATTAVIRRDGLTVSTAENVNNPTGHPDLLPSLDQLQAALPHLDHVNLVVGWFGDDLRCGRCQVRPGVDRAEKATLPFAWRAGGVDRSGAHLVSESGGGPAYGGTPSDRSVIEAIRELTARGIAVTLYPFLFMDIPAGSALPDPGGAGTQPPYPWRGRITGEAGADKTAAAASQVQAFFGRAGPGDFTAAADHVDYHGPDEWSFRRFVLHCAHLAGLAGGVEGFVIGSELRGLTTLRSGPRAYPAVEALRSLAADCAAVLGAGTRIGYAADWSEYFGHQPAAGSGDAIFHLDPLWADPHIGFVGVDWYPPLSDWRDGADQADVRAGYTGPSDAAYLAAGVEGGEGYDWFYGSDADRAAQVHRPIADGAYGEPWVFRPKDLRGWWSHAHHDRPGGVRDAAPTAWTPGMKPVRLVEFGCPAVDRGANAPNLFLDPKSVESALPPFSSGDRDDLHQRRALEAIAAHFADDPMVERLSAWCWDARPFPDFPARTTVWSDAANWSRGHWLNGRMGAATVSALAEALLARAGVADAEIAGLEGVVDGYVIDRPMATTEALAPLAAAFAFDLAERGGRVALVGRDGQPVIVLSEADTALPDAQPSPIQSTRALKPLPSAVRVRFIDGAKDYRTGAVAARSDDPEHGGERALDLPMVTDQRVALAAGRRRLARLSAERDTAALHLAPATALAVEPADVVRLSPDGPVWRVARVDLDEAPRLTLQPLEDPVDPDGIDAGISAGAAAQPQGPPALFVLDLPPLPGRETDGRPLAAAAASPWRPFEISAGETATVRASIDTPAGVGRLLEPMPPGAVGRFDPRGVAVVMEGAVLSSASRAAVLAGANALAVLCDDGAWELIQYQTAELVGPATYRLSGLLRAQSGTEAAMRSGAAAGAPVVMLDDRLVPLTVAQSERGLTLSWTARCPTDAGGLSATTVTAAWAGVADRPFSPCHLRVQRRADFGAVVRFIRRTRIGGDPWSAGEVPLSETVERYRLRGLSGGLERFALEIAGSPAALSAAQCAGIDAVAVSQFSDRWGWGAEATAALA